MQNEKINLSNICLLTVNGIKYNKSVYEKINNLFDFQCKDINFNLCLHLNNSIDLEYERVETKNTTIHSVKIPELSYYGYSKFCVEYLYHYVKNIDCEYFIMFHDDGFIINPELWKQDFLNYDYIGAPWDNNPDEPQFGWVKDYGLKTIVGNGGFCLRSKKFLYESSKLNYTSTANEDVFLCAIMNDYLTSNGIKFAPLNLARNFSLETKTIENNTLSNCFGFHGKHNLKEVEDYLMSKNTRLL